MNPQPPFVKNVTFTLMGLPQVHVSAIPMTERGINVLNLPVISGFVNNSIAAAANEYVAPKSMSLDVGKLLVGDDIKKGPTSLIRPELKFRYRCNWCPLCQNSQSCWPVCTRSKWGVRYVYHVGIF
jgi:hypothetical protein